MKRLLSFLMLGYLAATAPAIAQSKNPLADRENKVPPIISYLMSQGIKLTSFGEVGGLQGYLGEDATGKMQTFYVSPDGNHVAAGILFGLGGKNITGIQIGEMRARFDAAAREFEGASVQSNKANDAAPVTTTAPEIPASPSTEEETKASTDKGATDFPEWTPPPAEALPGQEAATPAEDDKDADQVTALPVSSGIKLPEATGPIEGASGNPSEIWVSKMDKDAFLKAANELPYFEVGSISAPATLWMIADPQCPYCHQTWDHIRPFVYNRKLKVRVILIAGLPGSRPIAQDMLARPLPARAWLDSDGGRNFTPAVDPKSPEFAKAEEFLDKNIDFAFDFGFDRTPFLAYTATDGNFYSTLGLPNDLPSFLAAAGI